MAVEHKDSLKYIDSGVNYELLDPFKIACQQAALTTSKNIERFKKFGLNVSENNKSRGESAYEVNVEVLKPIFLRYAHVEEGLGTKNEIADQMRQLKSKIVLAKEIQTTYGTSFYKGIAIDNAAMILNDLATRGASPVSFMLHVAAYPSSWFSDEHRNEDLISGTVKACNQARCSWGGGESPALRDIINSGHNFLSGSAIGFSFPQIHHLPDEENIRVGDRIILIKSSGPHANGITLLRTDLLKKLPNGYETLLSNGQNYGEAILTPTLIYSRLIDGLLEKNIPINYAVHISGHGWRKLMRAKKDFSYVIDKVPEIQPIFQTIQEYSGMSNKQIYGDYNMGAGFAIFTEENRVKEALNIADNLGYQAFDAGYIEEGSRKVEIKPLNIQLDSLDIR